mmetsp:Transcript_6616/g.16511  ORF Transcript_6616/g.16511 Transcript_6616/m.16511 type:complete len:112 (+) Transcript_6616:1191-1526(+)
MSNTNWRESKEANIALMQEYLNREEQKPHYPHNRMTVTPMDVVMILKKTGVSLYGPLDQTRSSPAIPKDKEEEESPSPSQKMEKKSHYPDPEKDTETQKRRERVGRATSTR